MSNVTREYRRSNRLCIYCGEPQDREGKVTCSKCAEKRSEYQNNRKIEFEKINRCVECGKKKTFEKTKICIDCRQKRLDQYYTGNKRELNRESQKKRIFNWKENGLCSKCGKEIDVDGYARCSKCREKDRIYAIKARERNKEDIARYERPAYGMCYRCGKPELYKNYHVCYECYQLQCKSLSFALPENNYFRNIGKYL